MHYKLEGKTPVKIEKESMLETSMEWAKCFEEADRIVARDIIGDIKVSTVFLGIDHQITPDRPPLLFETLVFGGPLDGEMFRYSTWEEAEKGHKKMVRMVINQNTKTEENNEASQNRDEEA